MGRHVLLLLQHLLLQYPLLQRQHPVSILKGPKITPVIFWRGFPCYSSSPYSLFDNDTHDDDVAATFLSEDVPCLGFTKFSPAVPFGPNQGNIPECCLRRGDGKECPPYTHNDTKALMRYVHNDREAERKLILAASSRSGRTKSQHV